LIINQRFSCSDRYQTQSTKSQLS